MICNVSKIDLKELDKQIDMYGEVNGQSPKYIIMNDATAKKLFDECFYSYYCHWTDSACEAIKGYASYKGIMIAYCNKLSLFEIELV